MAPAVLRLLFDAGLTQEQALFHYELFTDTLMGLHTVDAMRESLDEDTRRTDDAALATLYANIARAEPRASRLPALAISSDPDALFAAQVDLHIEAIRATATGTPAVAHRP
ncbi:hypothetical protein ACFV2H_13665 [Streptomyces sp. NPDC059629]|uniref:hypothetical protein n=1 Tax=Streptomyces sp. NPDC059629 TaxID=3346889 RepID=UPI0036BEAB06